MQPTGFILDGTKVLLQSAIFEQVAFVSPTTLYVGYLSGPALRSILCPADITGPSYARVAVAATLANWSKDTHGQRSNAVKISFPAPTGTWTQAWAIGVYSVASGGLPIWAADLQAPVTFTTGDSPNIPIGGLVLQL